VTAAPHDQTAAHRATAAGVRIPPAHHHRDISGGPLRPALFGAMDGLVSNTSLLAGVAAGGASHHTVLLTGLAGVVAGAFSMSAGEYSSVLTQREATLAEVAMERLELRRSPHAESAELAEAYEERGLAPALAKQVADELMAQPEMALRAHAQEELGVDIDRLPNPWLAAGSSMSAFAVGAFIPVLPYAVGSKILGVSMLACALVLAAVALFAAGAVASRFTGRRVWYSGSRQLVLGAVAASVTYGVGALVGTGVS
jgi:VIT1/CCC1 family predicted Fe2+/Mn2+ transporter